MFIFFTVFVQSSILKSEESRLKKPSKSNAVEASKSATTSKGLKRFRVGQKAPLIEGFAADGHACNIETNKGSFMLLTYWSLNDKNYAQNLQTVERIFKKYQDRTDFKVVSFWNEDWTEYMAEMNQRGKSFYSSRDWWKLKFILTDLSVKTAGGKDRIWSTDLKGAKAPTYILLDKEMRFLAIDIPSSQLEKTVDSHLNSKVKKKKTK